eukprot:TRINITY_DN18575_c0_g3_i2.p1 TRINITY_DN18575_c0_g3~~TRINITY_DN18575_c0_g3_i2.p1  ORF type:complete len:311 (+),score=57.55 TRINITY_DN18575_c0_g3_i2:63-995(+)
MGADDPRFVCDVACVKVNGEPIQISPKLVNTPIKDGPTWLVCLVGVFVLAFLIVVRTSERWLWQLGLLVSCVVLGVVLIVVAVYFTFLASKDLSQHAMKFLLPLVMSFIDWRLKPAKKELLKGLQGRVLDVGCGSGMYMQYYVKSRLEKGEKGVQEVVLLEPNVYLRPLILSAAEKARQQAPGLKLEVVTGFIQELTGTASFDSIIFGNVLCEVEDVPGFLDEVGRLLKPGGRLYFCEHLGCRPHNSWRRRLQDAINPIWRVVSDGCNCNRDSVERIKALDWVESVYSWGFPASAPFFRFEMGIGLKKST